MWFYGSACKLLSYFHCFKLLSTILDFKDIYTGLEKFPSRNLYERGRTAYWSASIVYIVRRPSHRLASITSLLNVREFLSRLLVALLVPMYYSPAKRRLLSSRTSPSYSCANTMCGVASRCYSDRSKIQRTILFERACVFNNKNNTLVLCIKFNDTHLIQ